MQRLRQAGLTVGHDGVGLGEVEAGGGLKGGDLAEGELEEE
jgi:hypothetical protein